MCRNGLTVHRKLTIVIHTVSIVSIRTVTRIRRTFSCDWVTVQTCPTVSNTDIVGGASVASRWTITLTLRRSCGVYSVCTIRTFYGAKSCGIVSVETISITTILNAHVGLSLAVICFWTSYHTLKVSGISIWKTS